MADCPLLAGCPFFAAKLGNMPATAHSLMLEYCKRDYERCARYRVRSLRGAECVPLSLFPHEHERVEGIARDCPGPDKAE